MSGTFSRYQNSITNTRTVEITTVSPEQLLVQALDPSGAQISISLDSPPIVFRWPTVGELWSVEQRNGRWYLADRQTSQNDSEYDISEGSEGSTHINGFPVLIDGKRAVRTHAALLGDGTHQSFKIYHNLDTRYVSVWAYPANHFESTLALSFSAKSTALTLVDATLLPNSGSVYVGINKIDYTGKSGNVLTGLTREIPDVDYAEGEQVTTVISPVTFTHKVINEHLIEVNFPTVYSEYGVIVTVIG